MDGEEENKGNIAAESKTSTPSTVPPLRKAAKGKKPNVRKGNSATKGSTSGFTETLRSASSGIQVLFEPEHTFYCINVVAIITFASKFDASMRSLSRRGGGHPVCKSYAAIFLWALLSKLCRVGVETRQLVLTAAQTPSSLDIKLPPLVAQVVDCFGEFEDTSNHVIVAPRVTLPLLTALYRIVSACLSTVAGVVANVLDPANYRSYLDTCYGAAAKSNYVANHMCNTIGLNVRFRASDDQPATIRRAAGMMLYEIADLTANVANPLTVARITDFHIDTWGTAGDNWNVQSGQMFANPAPLTIGARAAALAAVTDAAAPFGAPHNVLALSAAFPSVGNENIFTTEGHIQYLASIFNVQAISVTRSGSAAATAVLTASGTGFSISSHANSLSVQESLIGALLQQDDVVWTTFGGNYYAFHSFNQTVRCHTSPISHDKDALLARAFRDGAKPGTY